MSYFSSGQVELVARKGYSGVGDIWGTIKDIGSSIGKGALDLYGQKARAEGAAEAYKEQAAAAAGRRGGMPGWVLPAAAIGGAALLIVLLKKKR